MAGLFDDLVPSGNSGAGPAAGNGLFDDLVPAQSRAQPRLQLTPTEADLVETRLAGYKKHRADHPSAELYGVPGTSGESPIPLLLGPEQLQDYVRQEVLRERPQRAEQAAFDASRTPFRQLSDAAGFAVSLPVRMATKGKYGIGDAGDLISPQIGQEWRRKERDFARANQDWMEPLGHAAEAGLGVPVLASMGAVPGQMLRTAGASAGQANALASRFASPVTTPVVAVGKSVRDAVGDVIPGFGRTEDARLFRTLERQGQTPEDALNYLTAGQDTAKFGKTQSPLPETIADTGPAAKRLVRTLEVMPGKASTEADEFLSARQRGVPEGTPGKTAQPGQYERTMEHLKRSLQVTRDDFNKTKGRLVDEMKTASAPLYDEFRALKNGEGEPLRIDVGPVLQASEEADSSLAPALKSVVQKARREFMDTETVRDVGRGLNEETLLGKDAIVGSAPTSRLTAARFDSGKQALDDMIEAAKGRGLNNQMRLLTVLKNELVEVADRATMRPVTAKQKVPVFDSAGNSTLKTYETPVMGKDGKPAMRSVYAEARDAFSSPAELKDALEAGRTFMTGESAITPAQYKAMTTAEKRMFRIGVVHQGGIELGRKTRGTNLAGYFDRPNMENTLSEVMTPKNYRKFRELIGREGTMVTPYRGSQTGPILEDVADFNFMTRVARTIKEKGVIGAAADFAGNVIERMTRMREKDALKMADMLFETDPGRQAAILTRVGRTYGRTQVRAAFSVIVTQAERMARQATRDGNGQIAELMLELSAKARAAAANGQPAAAP